MSMEEVKRRAIREGLPVGAERSRREAIDWLAIRLDRAEREWAKARARVEELEALLSDMPNAHADPMRDFYNRVLVALYRESGGEEES